MILALLLSLVFGQAVSMPMCPVGNIIVAGQSTYVCAPVSPPRCQAADIDASSGYCTVPDPQLTPGEMDESLACISNKDRPRKLSDATKSAILQAYGWPANTKKSIGEFDHWLPHWMGGSDTAHNIWFEPHAGKFGSFAKDKVELRLWRAVCVDKTMTLKQAKMLYLSGWTWLVKD